MKAADDSCPSCRKFAEVTPEYIEEVVAARRLSCQNPAGESEYRRRLLACAGCDACAGGEMCAYCGCFVRFRALSLNSGCPNPAGDRWAGVSHPPNG